MSDEEPTSSGFSFLAAENGGPAEDVATDAGDMGISTDADAPEESGFSFVQSPSSASAEDMEPASAFSFMQSPSSDQQHAEEEGVDEADSVGGSGFDFLQSDTAPLPSSAFSFMGPREDSLEAGAVVDEPPLIETAKEIKLEKAASARNVKKKRRATKVGYGRDEDPPEDEAPAPAPARSGGIPEPPAPSPAQPPAPSPAPTAAPTAALEREAATVLPDIATPSPPARVHGEVLKVATLEHSPGHAAKDTANTEKTREEQSQEKDKKQHSFFDFFRRGCSAPDPSKPESTKPDHASPPQSAPADKPRSRAPAPAAPAPAASTPTRKPAESGGSEADMFSGMDTSSPATESLKAVVQTAALPAPAPAPSPVAPQPPAVVAPSVPPRAATRAAKESSVPKQTSESKAETAKKVDNVFDTLTVLGDEIVDQLRVMMGKMSEERQARLDVVTRGLHEISQLEAEVQKTQREISDLESEQLRLGELEDFEAAAALSDLLDNYHKKVLQCQLRMKDLNADVQKAQSGISESHKFCAQDLAHTVKGLGNIRRQKEEEWSKWSAEWEQKYSADDIAVKGEEERIQLEMTHVLREEESLNEEGAVIETQITNQTEALSGSRAGLESRLHTTLGEIAELELALAAKRADETELREELRKTESSISEVRRKYERQLQRIYDRRTAALKAQEECSQEVLMIQKERVSLTQALLEHERMSKDNEAWLEITDAGMRAVSEFLDTMSASLDLDSKISSESTTSDNSEISEVKAQLKKCELSLMSAAEDLAVVEARSSHLAQENQDISEKLPLLEAEKKGHAASKRFKEAATVSKDIKFLSTRKEEIEKDIEGIGSEIDLCRSKTRECENELVVLKNKLKEAEKETDLMRFEILLKKAALLNASKVRLRGEGFAVDTKISPIAVSLIDVELKASLTKAAELKEKHSIDRSLDEEDLFTPAIAEAVAEKSEIVAHDDELVNDLRDTDRSEKMIFENTEVEVSDADAIQATEVEEQVSVEAENDKETSAVQPNVKDDSSCNEASTAAALIDEDRELALSAIKDAQERIAELETNLQDAVDAEDYDEAASISDAIEELRSDVEQRVLQLK